jgi:hypothetical protein
VDHEYQQAINAGERNRTGFELVRNWCAHVRIEKFGGTGLVEQMTGLPIGNHGRDARRLARSRLREGRRSADLGQSVRHLPGARNSRDGRKSGNARCQMQKSAAPKFHGGPLRNVGDENRCGSDR